ncbi:GPI mannosyltransferase 2-like [Lytechinus pictus]|uniref:GPI mannosyltransferase 2-like n=1 Tax=Lytechinus pictus TaxID=7653 RepID=UPI0030B9DF34
MATTMDTKCSEMTIANYAVLSRFFVTLLQILLKNLIPDHHADAFHQAPLQNPRFADRCVEFLLGGFRKWDGAYFLHIAEHGYTADRMLVFFPLYPGLTRLLADTLFVPLQTMMSVQSVLMVSGWLVSTASFAMSAVMLHALTKKVCNDQLMAHTAWILYCINPATIFMTAMYTEASFSLLSFTGMIFLEKKRYLISAIVFGLGTCTRSNGIVAVGFVMYHMVQITIFVIARIGLPSSFSTLKKLCTVFAINLTRIVYSTAIILTPFALYQIYSYLRICKGETAISVQTIMEHCLTWVLKFGSNNTVDSQMMDKLDQAPLWCRKSFVLPYSELQAEHWNVGLLNYYEFKQLPNFILALPIIILGLYGVWDYCNMNWDLVKVLGLYQPIRRDVKKTDDPTGQSEGFYSSGVFVYLVHHFVLLIFGVLCMHVQVITRFLFSSSPIPIWIASHIIQSSLQQDDTCTPSSKHNGSIQKFSPLEITWRKHLDWKGRLLRGYFLGYCVIGVALHCNFLPWT